MSKRVLWIFAWTTFSIFNFFSLDSCYSEEIPYEKLQPIFENYIRIYSPQEQKYRSFKVEEILKVFLLELKKYSLSYHISLGGSSLF